MSLSPEMTDTINFFSRSPPVMEDKLDLFQKQYRMLHFSAILPYPSVSTSRWKSIPYSIFTFISMIYMPFTMVTMLFAILQYGDIPDILISIFYEVLLFAYIVLELFYWKFNSSYMRELFLTLETKYNVYIANVGTPGKSTIMKDSIDWYNKLMIMIEVICFLDIFAWAGVPFLIWCFETSEDYKSMDTLEYLKYFSNICWLPENATQAPQYYIVYSHQAFSSYLCGLYLTACNVIMFSFMYHVATHLKIIVAAFQDVDVLFPVIDPKRTESEGTKISETEDIFNLRDVDVHQKHDAGVYAYLTQCAKYHQEVLEFCYEVDKLMSPMLLATLVYIQISVCVPLLLVALGNYNGMAKYLIAVVEQFVMPCVICYYGDYVSQKSVEVNHAAFGSKWYLQSPRVKKLLQIVIMRSQKPVRFTAGHFYFISLETLGDIFNKVYAFFTILKGMFE